MKYLIVGYGNIGAKRKAVLGPRCVGTVDPVNPAADHKEAPADGYDAVILAVPNDAKLLLLERFLARGKHVLVEKPLVFPDAATADRLRALALRTGAVWYTAYNHRFEPQIAALKRQIDTIGRVYSARLSYGNGTVRNVAGSWREAGHGVLEDLGCHLLDLAGWLFGAQGSRVDLLELRALESKGYDRCLLATADRRIIMEGSFVSWKNTFTIDAFGDKGSIHLNGLRKWGPSELVVRERVFPSGVPVETRTVSEGPDVTWAEELRHFEERVEKRVLDANNDTWISGVINAVPRAIPARPDAAPTGFVGLSHLGIVSSIAWATLGRPVVAYDPDAHVVEDLRAGRLPIHEPGLAEALARAPIEFTSDPARLRDCPLIVVARDVPTDDDNLASLAPVEDAFDRVVPHAPQDATFVLMSQVPPGFTRRLRRRIRAARPELRFELCYQVETLIFGRALERALKPERFIVGCLDPRAPLPPALDRGLRLYGCPILPMRYESAELCKTAINLYLCGSVTYANTLSALCEKLGADWSEVVPALRLDRRIGPAAYIQPGLGIAGGNLERDLVTLTRACREHGVDPSFIETITALNERRHRWAVDLVERHVLGGPRRPVIAVWGLAYKKDTASTKNSRSLRIIRELADRADLRAYDPRVRDVDVPARLCGRDEAIEGADALLVMTDWDEFAKVSPSVFRRMRRPVVIDGAGILPDAPGVQRFAMGRPPRRPAVFLDRDGVLAKVWMNQGKASAPLALADFQVEDGAPEAVRRLREAGFLTLVVTNQPEVARGLLDPGLLDQMHRILRESTGVDDVFVCPHDRSQGCPCCKPRPGMLLDAAEKWNVDFAGSFMVGDRGVDVDAGRAAGVRTILVDRPYSDCPDADVRVPDLRGVVDAILEPVSP